MKRRYTGRSPKKQQVRSNSLRIIGGLWRGRKLPVRSVKGLRPTKNRVKETLFNWLGQEISTSHCLDLFSGAGSLGFEAASRRAKSVTMVELNGGAATQLRDNAARLGADNILVINGDAVSFLEQIPRPFDVVFLDPPFRESLIEAVTMRLELHQWLTNHALIYIESEEKWSAGCIPTCWNLQRAKIMGQVAFRLYKKY